MSGMHDRWETDRDAEHNCALVLAGGEGSRLQALTRTASGVVVPKQFCSMGTEGSLLEAALRRARTVAPAERIFTIVTEHQRRWWQGLPLGIPTQNVIVQPRNRGTGNGILLPLLQIVRRDPLATLLVLPSDHYVRNEDVLAEGLTHAMLQVAHKRNRIVLLGVTPEDADPELGYIVADGDSTFSARAVTQFIEKPDAETARALLERGGVWNSFIFAADARTLLRLFEARRPELVAQTQRIVEEPEAAVRAMHLAELYEHLPQVDFSRDVLQGAASLSVMTVPACGWSDLGTPRRVLQTMHRYGTASNFCRVPA